MASINEVVIWYPLIASEPLDGLFTQDPSSEKWNRLNKFIQKREFGTKEQLNAAFRPTKENVVLMQAIVTRLNEIMNPKQKESGLLLGNILKNCTRMLQYVVNP